MAPPGAGRRLRSRASLEVNPRGADTRCSTCATVGDVTTRITQRELRNQSGDIMRRLDRGESFIVTRNGVPVGELSPVRRRRAASPEDIAAAFRGAPRIDFDEFRADLDRVVDQGIEPRA